MRTLRFFTALLLLPLALGGCDQVEDSLFSFNVDGLAFTFSFDGSQVNNGGAQLVASGMVDLLAAVEQQGFSGADISSVRLESGSAQIRILNAPSGTDIGFLDAVSLRIIPGTATNNGVVVATQDDFDSMTGTMSGEAELDVTNDSFGILVPGGPLGATLDVDATAAQDGQTYRLETRFDVVVEVETL